MDDLERLREHIRTLNGVSGCTVGGAERPDTRPDTDADDRLAIATAIVGAYPYVLGGMVRVVGTLTEVKVTERTREYVTAALLLADHLMRANREFVPPVDSGGEPCP